MCAVPGRSGGGLQRRVRLNPLDTKVGTNSGPFHSCSQSGSVGSVSSRWHDFWSYIPYFVRFFPSCASSTETQR